MLMLMSALAHITFMALFGGFLLVVRNAGEEAGGDMSVVRSRPEVGAGAPWGRGEGGREGGRRGCVERGPRGGQVVGSTRRTVHGWYGLWVG